MNIVIYGASSLGACAHGIAVSCKASSVVFYDDFRETILAPGVELIEGWSSLRRLLLDKNFKLCIAVGSPSARRQVWEKVLKDFGANSLASLIHPRANIMQGASIGSGAIIFPGATVAPYASIGQRSVLNANCSIGAYSSLSDDVSVGPNASIGSECGIGHQALIGMGASVLQQVKICGSVSLGAMSLANHDIDVPGTYVGIPARRIDRCC